ncbi:hypothetical protein ACFFMN_23000 [Planobispora siamensis]|uniref:Uncharacterized protein n=1 Tax=Planobispora siamensis TaxID=936338 RepID=A0A8J3SMR9_9ACTN|nr:hypothetical protein [Planobispora siamensis]GIH95436.1 hypothetical protein Psi01_60660 [Planobispora siamensis]
MRAVLRRDLDTAVARQVLGRATSLAAQVAAEAAARAPAARVWVTMGDDRVRPSHQDAHRQMIPANLRFKLRKQSAAPGRRAQLLAGYDLAREPRDPSLPAGQRGGCRCIAITVPGVIAAKVQAHPAVLTGSRAVGRVSVAFPRIVESHTGTSDDAPAPFLANAIDAVAARLRARASARP